MRKLIEVSREFLIECDSCYYKVLNDGGGIGKDLKEYIDQKCPKCGANLLTEKDYLLDKKITKTIHFINRWFSWLTIFIRKPKVVTGEISYSDGVKINIDEPEPGK